MVMRMRMNSYVSYDDGDAASKFCLASRCRDRSSAQAKAAPRARPFSPVQVWHSSLDLKRSFELFLTFIGAFGGSIFRDNGNGAFWPAPSPKLLSSELQSLCPEATAQPGPSTKGSRLRRGTAVASASSPAKALLFRSFRSIRWRGSA